MVAEDESTGSPEGHFERCRRKNSAHPNGMGDANGLCRQAATATVRSVAAIAAEQGHGLAFGWNLTPSKQPHPAE